jgi:hypothetical protein
MRLGNLLARRTRLWLDRLLARSPNTRVLRHHEIPQHLALTGEAQSGFALVGRKVQAQAFHGAQIGNPAFDPNRTGSARAEAPAVERSSDTVVEREPRAQQNHSEIRSVWTFHRVASEANRGHDPISPSRHRTMYSQPTERAGNERRTAPTERAAQRM